MNQQKSIYANCVCVREKERDREEYRYKIRLPSAKRSGRISFRKATKLPLKFIHMNINKNINTLSASPERCRRRRRHRRRCCCCCRYQYTEWLAGWLVGWQANEWERRAIHFLIFQRKSSFVDSFLDVSL